MARALVAYASKYGSTEEVARYVGAVLRDRGLQCDVVAAGEAGSVTDYGLVVLGTGLYMGRLHRDARRFLRTHHRALAGRPFAAFALGPLGSGAAEKEKVRPQLERGIARHEDVTSLATAVFGGVIVPERMSFPFTHMPAGDFRDWDEIREFALALAALAPVVASGRSFRS